MPPIKKWALFEQVAQRLEDRILKNIYKPGDKLLPEQTLANEFGVSRNVIREAHKGLMERGLVVIKQGKGTFVTKPSPTVTKQALRRFIHREKTSFIDLYEIRFTIELVSAKLAAERASNEDLVAIEYAIKTMEKKAKHREGWARADLEFHLGVARATHNSLFPLLLEPIGSQLLESFVLGYEVKGVIEGGLTQHLRIIEKIRAKDSSGAEEAMLVHLLESEKRLKRLIENAQEVESSSP